MLLGEGHPGFRFGVTRTLENGCPLLRRSGDRVVPRPRPIPDPAPGRRPFAAHGGAVRAALAPLRFLARGRALAEDVAALEPEHVARFLGSTEALKRPDGRAKRTGSLNALRSSLRSGFDYIERAALVAHRRTYGPALVEKGTSRRSRTFSRTSWRTERKPRSSVGVMSRN
jgi:hypothetical protein